jgi:hypothetical protein
MIPKIPYWKNAYPDDLERLRLTSYLLNRYPKLIEFLFHPEKPELSSSPEELKKKTSAFSSGEELLVRISLDIWSSSGRATLIEIMEKLDDRNFENMLKVFRMTWKKPATHSKWLDETEGWDEYEAHLESLASKSESNPKDEV